MKVSVIVPYFKGASYLEECVGSIVDQNLRDIEILIVDDRNGHDVPESVLAIDQVKHIVLEEELDADAFFEKKRRFLADRGLEAELEPGNVDMDQPLSGEQELLHHPFGVAAARNAGVRHAAGEYLYFIDADDYLWEDALAKLVKLADERRAKVVTGTRCSSWFRPRSFSFEKSAADYDVQGVIPLRGEVLTEVLKSRFTMQHLLIRKDYYDSLGLAFNEYHTLYTDVPVVAAVFAGAAGEIWADGSSVYVWRRHNDPIHLPALCQQKRTSRIREYIESYEASCEAITRSGQASAAEQDAGTSSASYPISLALDQWMCRFVLARFPDGLNEKMGSRFMKHMQRIGKQEQKSIKNRHSHLQKMELFWLFRGNYAIAKGTGKLGKILKKIKGIMGKPIKRWMVLEKLFFRKLPIRKDWVFLESFFGKSYSDSPKYLYEKLYDMYGDKYRFIWCLNKRPHDMKGHPTICRRQSLRYVYYITRAKYIICNTRQPIWYRKREGAVFLQTWHGTPLKKLAFDLDDIHAASQDHKTKFFAQSRDWDYLISANRFSTDVFERAFCYPREKIIETGYPRNDILYSDHAEEIGEGVRTEFGIPDGRRVILYAPTYRDDQFYKKGEYKFSLQMDLQRMRAEFSQEYVILLRTHYHIANAVDLTGLEDFVYQASGYGDVSKLYLASDICITDYSSVFFDFANLKRPMLFFVYDYENYRNELRGMYIDMERELPGPIVRTNDELVDALHHIDQISRQYRERYETFYEKFCHVDDGGASERAIRAVFGKE